VLVPPTIAVLDDACLRQFYDPGSLARGRAYAEERRVELISALPGTLKAVCRGSGRATYVLTVRWTHRRGFVELDDSCTCPLGGACKHCVAAILTARRHASGTGPSASPGPSLDWRRALAELATRDADDDVVPAGLALELAIQRPSPSRFQASADPKVTVRPLRRGKGGKWIKTGASWRDMDSQYGPHLAGIDPLQRAALRALMVSGRITYYSNSQAVSLAQFGPDLWYQLERALDVGVELVGQHEATSSSSSPPPHGWGSTSRETRRAP
jgi:hypothetical protein